MVARSLYGPSREITFVEREATLIASPRGTRIWVRVNAGVNTSRLATRQHPASVVQRPAIEGSFLEPDDVEAGFTHAGPTLRPNPTHAYVAGLDLGTVNDAAVLAVVHAEGRTNHLDHMTRWQGTRANPVSLEAVVAYVEAVNDRFRLRRLIVELDADLGQEVGLPLARLSVSTSCQILEGRQRWQAATSSVGLSDGTTSARRPRARVP